MHSTIESQLAAWLAEGFTTEDILAQAAHTWPGLTRTYVESRVQQLQQGISSPVPATATLLQLVLHKRLAEVERLEKRLEDEKCPLSVHTLYRGLLRDLESYCLKMAANEQPPSRPARLQPRQPELENSPEKALPPASGKKAKDLVTQGAGTLSLLFAFLVSILVGFSSCSKRLADRCTLPSLVQNPSVASALPLLQQEDGHNGLPWIRSFSSSCILFAGSGFSPDRQHAGRSSFATAGGWRS